MKKIILNSIAILGLSLSTIAQDNIHITMVKTGTFPLVATGDVTDYSSGHSAFEYNVSSSNTVNFEMDIENNTGVSKSWRITRFNEVGTPSDWTSYICCGVACFPVSTANPYVTPASNFTANPQIIKTIEVANGGTGFLSFHVTPNSAGTGRYMLYLTDNDNTVKEDSIEININSSVGIKEVKQTPSFSMYPNPSTDFVTLELNNGKTGTVKIVDLVGNVVYSESIISTAKLNVSEFKNGIYFVTVESEGIKLSSRKLVIRH